MALASTPVTEPGDLETSPVGLAGPSVSQALCCGSNLPFVISRFQSSYLFLDLPCFYFDSANSNRSLVFPRKQFSDCLACQDELRGRESSDVKPV